MSEVMVNKSENQVLLGDIGQKSSILRVIPDVIFVIDMQNDFVKEGGALFSESGAKIIPDIARFLNIFALRSSMNRSIVFTRDTHDRDYSNTREGTFLPIPHTLYGSGGWALVDELNSFALDNKAKVVIRNKTQFAMNRKDADDICRDIREEKRARGKYSLRKENSLPEPKLTIALCGVLTDVCVVTNALMLRSLFPEDEIVVFGDYCAGSTLEKHQEALSVMESCHIRTIPNPFDFVKN